MNNLVAAIYQHMVRTSTDAETRMKPFAILYALTSPIYYLINIYVLESTHYENIFLRFFSGLLAVLLLLKDSWPQKLRAWLPLYWYFTLLYSLPFFILFMLLKNEGITAWVLNFIAVSLLLSLLVDWISYIFILGIGMVCGYVAYVLTTSGPFVYNPGTVQVSDIVSTFLASVIMVTVFAQKREKMEEGKLETIMAVAAGIAHELRTPLASIEVGAGAMEETLPTLIEGYQSAKKNNLIESVMTTTQLNGLMRVPKNIQIEVNSALIVIDLLLTNVKQRQIHTRDDIFLMGDCVNSALTRYPFKGTQASKVHWTRSGDFTVRGDQELMIYVLFNLLKNALYFIAKAMKGEIWIELTEDEKYSYLIFKDTGLGIPEEDLPNMFSRFFSRNTHHGTGLGLSFCKMVVEAHKGKIRCEAVEGEYTAFILSFPKK